uniref:Ycf1 n=1 Tax=Cyathodium smaragdinum TaxID=2846787 RepID=A0A8F2XVN4_9MARC|nr:Ycf1 [Cyathodium smaragdinum]
MILISQAYIFQRGWEIKTENKSYLKYLLKYWTSHLYLKNKIKNFFFNRKIDSSLRLKNISENDWKEWLKDFNQYSLSSREWSKIGPRKWRNRVNERWRKNENEDLKINRSTNKIAIFNNFPSKRIRKRNRILKKNFLISSYFNPEKDSTIEKFLNFEERNIYNDIIIEKIGVSYSFYDRKEKYLSFFSKNQNIFFEYNFLLWMIPEFTEDGDEYQTKKILFIERSILERNSNKMIEDRKLFQKRKINQSIRQWRWKSEDFGKELKKLGNMASVMTFMQTQNNVSVSNKMREDLELFNIFFRKNENNNINQLTINSEHRLGRLFDDQFLMYKTVIIFLNLKYRIEQTSNFSKFDHFVGVQLLEREEKNHLFFFNSFNLENIFFSKQRRKFRILNSLILHEKKNEQFYRKNLKKKLSENETEKIKRFFWAGYRFEDLACMNRFWCNTINGSRFSMIRFRMYPFL